MEELIYLVMGEFLVSLLMGLAALCLFLWAVGSGALRHVERVKYQVLQTEGIEHDDADRR
jgi:cbb3-type cytochrome oxidase maturation protein